MRTLLLAFVFSFYWQVPISLVAQAETCPIFKPDGPAYLATNVTRQRVSAIVVCSDSDIRTSNASETGTLTLVLGCEGKECPVFIPQKHYVKLSPYTNASDSTLHKI